MVPNFWCNTQEIYLLFQTGRLLTVSYMISTNQISWQRSYDTAINNEPSTNPLHRLLSHSSTNQSPCWEVHDITSNKKINGLISHSTSRLQRPILRHTTLTHTSPSHCNVMRLIWQCLLQTQDQYPPSLQRGGRALGTGRHYETHSSDHSVRVMTRFEGECLCYDV